MLHLCGSWSYPFLWGCDWWHLQKTSVFGAATLSVFEVWDLETCQWFLFVVLKSWFYWFIVWRMNGLSLPLQIDTELFLESLMCIIDLVVVLVFFHVHWQYQDLGDSLEGWRVFYVFPHAEILACLAFVPYPVLQWANSLQLSVRHQILHFMFKVFLSLNTLLRLPIDFSANIHVSMLKVALDFWCFVSHPFPQANAGS